MEVKLLTRDELVWPIGRQDSVPEYLIKSSEGGYGRNIKVDPYPCYPPNLELVKTLVSECDAAFPLKTVGAASFFVLSHEATERINGVTYNEAIYDDDKKGKMLCYCGCGKEYETFPQSLFVVLFAKRIPIHPAMLRYLVAHEYGHMVFHYVARKLGYRDSDEYELYKKYMEIRGVDSKDYSLEYAGGKWHRSPGEIVANDFRLIFTGQEREFWPHEVPLPESTPILDWWRTAAEKSDVEVKF